MSTVSTLMVDFALETCTAGDSPKKFGTVERNAASITTAMSAYFQAGKRFT